MEMAQLCKSRLTRSVPLRVARASTFPTPCVNTGSEAISSAEIWIEVYDGERVVESAEINVQFLPLQGKQDGMFVTTQRPGDRSFPTQRRV